MENEPFAILLNLLISGLGGYLCVCRMAMMGPRTKDSIRFQYVVWFTAFASSGISWLYDSPPNPAQVILTASIVIHLALGAPVWRHGAPPFTIKGSG